MSSITLFILENWVCPKMSKLLLGGENYMSWVSEAKAVLATSGLWKYFNAKDPSSVIPPDTKPSGKDLWIVKNTTLVFTTSPHHSRLHHCIHHME